MPLAPKVDHDRLAAWAEMMKKVYNEAIAAHAEAGEVNGADLGKIRNHLECLAMIPQLLRELVNSVARDFGRFNFILKTQATLTRANGEIVPVLRRPKSMSLAWDYGPKGPVAPCGFKGEENG
jgi:hypothetical protein